MYNKPRGHSFEANLLSLARTPSLPPQSAMLLPKIKLSDPNMTFIVPSMKFAPSSTAC